MKAKIPKKDPRLESDDEAEDDGIDDDGVSEQYLSDMSDTSRGRNSSSGEQAQGANITLLCNLVFDLLLFFL